VRRLLALVALQAVLVVSPAWGQMRGGGGGRVAMGGARGGFVGGGRFVGGGHFVGRPAGTFTSGGVFIRFGTGPFFPRFRRGFFPYFPYAYSYPVSYPMYVYPDSYGTSAPYQSYDNSYAYSQNQALADQVARLSDEVSRLRAEQEARFAPTPRQTESATAAFPTVLVFRDRHREEVSNYAVVGQTLWIFDEQRARKIPVSQIDVPATTKVNDERGTEFHLPK